MDVVFVRFHHVNREARLGSYLGEQAFDFIVNLFVVQALSSVLHAEDEVVFQLVFAVFAMMIFFLRHWNFLQSGD